MITALKNYFENIRGTGVFSTADKSGRVNSAVFGRPYFLERDQIGFIMLKRLNHHNLKSNAHASYLFIEDGEKRSGVRLHLTKSGEEEDLKQFQTLSRHSNVSSAIRERVLVLFRVDRVLPLVGDDLNLLPFEVD